MLDAYSGKPSLASVRSAMPLIGLAITIGAARRELIHVSNPLAIITLTHLRTLAALYIIPTEDIEVPWPMQLTCLGLPGHSFVERGP